jgi:MFS family permease
MLGITDYYLIPYGLFLGATTSEIGILVAVPHLLASFAQLFAVQAVQLAGSRLRFLVSGASLQAALLVPIAVLALKPFSARISILVILASVFRIVGNLIGTAWGSLMSDYLLPHQRGNYFGRRAQAVGIAGLAGIALSGLFLYVMKERNQPFGFFVLFMAASFCRVVSRILMAQMTDLPLHKKPDSDFTFYMFVRRFKESNFVKFVLYAAGITFATHLASPYFGVYMLRHLHYSYLNYMLVQFASVAAGLVAFPLWGRHADWAGNAAVLKTTSFLIPLIPVLWLVSKNPAYLISVECFSGFVWGGFNLCASNFIYDAVSPEKRVRCIGYFNLINGTALFAGASLGGFLADRLPPWQGNPVAGLFLLSGVLRFAAHFFLSENFKEVRAAAKKVSSRTLFFSVVGIRPVLGTNNEWYIFPFLRKKRFKAYPSNH